MVRFLQVAVGTLRYDCGIRKPVHSSVFYLGHIGIDSIAYSPDGKTVASGCFNGTVLLWEPHI